MNRLVRSSSLGIAISLLLGGTAYAQQFDYCVQLCRSESRPDDCGVDPNAARQLCVEKNGCDALGAAQREICVGENRDEAACRDASARFRDCVTPCQEAFRAQMRACLDRMARCAEDQCGLELREPAGGMLFRGPADD